MMNSRDWLSQYNQVKNEIVMKRSTGRPVGAGDQRKLNTSIEALERDLRIMSQSPIEYEM